MVQPHYYVPTLANSFLTWALSRYPGASVLVKVTSLFSATLCKLLAMANSNFAFMKWI